MIYKLIVDENGRYTKDNTTYTLLEAGVYIDTPEGRNIDCFEYDSLEQAISNFGLTEIETITDNYSGIE